MSSNDKAYELDQYYTKKDIAQRCLNTIDLSPYDLVVEPSAGEGAFYNLINHPNKIGIDLEPKCNGVIEHDFLTWKLDNFPPKVLTIGAPPFGLGIGVGYQLALDFIEHASTFSTVIAFILPNGFKKERVHRRVPSNFCKLMDMNIRGDSFTFKGEPYDGYPCVWQIYMKRN